MFVMLSKYMFLGLFGLSLIQLIGFVVWGYASAAHVLPMSIAYAGALVVVSALAFFSEKKGERFLHASNFGIAAFLLLALLGVHLHPSDEVRAAIAAR